MQGQKGNSYRVLNLNFAALILSVTDMMRRNVTLLFVGNTIGLIAQKTFS